MKKLFENPDLEIVRFVLKDIISTSGGGQLDEDELPPVPVG